MEQIRNSEKYKKLEKEIIKTKKKIGEIVKNRIKEFKNNKNYFSELCFCILTANYTAEGGIRIQKEIGDFYNIPQKELENKLKKLGHRFPRTRAEYIDLAKKHKKEIECICKMKDTFKKREWLVENIKGLGYKEASHFLRNIGFLDVAIIDRHILSVLEEYGIIKRPKTITRKKYLEIEKILDKISKDIGLPLGELDLYLWYMKTGKILK